MASASPLSANVTVGVAIYKKNVSYFKISCNINYMLTSGIVILPH